jgi:geranylgeranyl diphosphate synthase type II
MKEFDQKLQEYKQFIEDYLRDFYSQFANEPQKKLFEAMRYSLFAGGKRLRPIMTMEFCRLCCGDYKKAAPFAAAIEMIQTYSLIHDDLPCMDNDDFRRGIPTNHKVYGEGTAVLAGDALLTDAFMLAASAELRRPKDIALAIGVLAHNAGSLGMAGGQMLDIDSENRILSEQEVYDIQSRKTVALINASCVLGVIAGGGTQEQMQAASMFAQGLGMAFQIRDDMLDVIGSAEEMGKSVGTDEKKNTFVRLYGLEKCEQMVEQNTSLALAALDNFRDNGFLRELALQLTSRMK